MCCKFGLFIFISSLFIAPAAILTPIPYFGSPNSPPIQSVARDAAGNIYIAGTTNGPIPLVNALQSKLGGGNCSMESGFVPCPNIFVAKFDPTGKKLIYSTYLGGDQSDFEAGLAVDSEGNAYIAGTTLPLFGDPGNAFIKKLSPDGSALLYTQYIGGDTMAKGIAVDANGNATIVGYNLGPDFPSVHPLPVQPFVKSLYVTNDGGLTWRGLNNDLSANNINALAVDPTNPATLYAATSSGLFKSIDAGSHWTRLLPAAAVADTVVIDLQHPSTVYVLYTSPSGNFLARSIDAGKTWTTISDNFPAPSGVIQPVAFAIDPSNSSVLWAVAIFPGSYPTVIKSTDSGDHWQVIYTFPQETSSNFTLAGQKLLIDPQNSSRIYACCILNPFVPVTSGVYRTDDAGKTWIRGSSGPFGGSVGILSPWLDPHDSSVLYGDWYYGLERSTNAGKTWNKISLPPGLPDHGYEPGGLALDASGTIYLLNDSGYLLKSSDRGSTWTKITGPWVPLASILAIDPTNPSTLYVASGATYGPAGTPAQHAFAARLNASGEIQWATLFGGSGQDQALAVALDSAGNAFITGNTNSDDFPLVNPFQAVRSGSTILATDAFVTKIGADGSNILYSSFLGGTGIDSGNAIAVDAAGSAYIAGGTTSVDFPVVGPLQPQPITPLMASFVAKVEPGGSKLVYSTLVAGSQNYTEQANAIVVDPEGRAFVAGITADAAFPLINPIQPTLGLGSSFVALLSPSGDSLDFSTYLGDLDNDIYALALAPNGTLLIAEGGGLDRLDFEAPPAQLGVPQVFAVYNAASYRLGDVVAPGEIVTLIGQELAPAEQTASSRTLPRSMQGVTVFVAGVAAPLFYVSPKQINFQVPVETPFADGPLVSQLEPLVVQRGTKTSATRTVDVQRFAPGLFAATADVSGTPVVVHTSDFSLVSEQNPAHPGEYLAAFCTGLGATNPPAKSGEPATAAAAVTNAPVTAEELDTGAPILVSYAGLAPGWVGLYQINFQLSETETAGQRNILFSIQGYSTNQGAIWVQEAAR